MIKYCRYNDSSGDCDVIENQIDDWLENLEILPEWIAADYPEDVYPDLKADSIDDLPL